MDRSRARNENPIHSSGRRIRANQFMSRDSLPSIDVVRMPIRANVVSATRCDDASSTYDSYSRCQHPIRIDRHSPAIRQNRAKDHFRHNRINTPNPPLGTGNIRTDACRARKPPNPNIRNIQSPRVVTRQIEVTVGPRDTDVRGIQHFS